MKKTQDNTIPGLEEIVEEAPAPKKKENAVRRLNLYEKIQAVSNDIKNIEKNLDVGGSQYGYKGVADADVLRAVKKAEREHRIVSIPIKQDIINSFHLTVVNKKGQESINYVDTIKMTVRIYDLDAPESYIDIETLAKGIDSADKGLGKASTYARKYALLNAYKLITGEDVDQDPSEPQALKVNEKLKLILNNSDEDRQMKMATHFGKKLEDMNDKELDYILNVLKKEGLIDV